MSKPTTTLASKGLKLFVPGCARLESHYEPREVASHTTEPATKINVPEYPRISMVIPSFNQGHFIGQTLQSITEQNYPNLELIIVDGGSSDETLEVIHSFAGHINWWVSEPDKGQANAINKGMAHATGEILAWLNSDDCLMPGALFKVARRFMASPDTDVIYGHRVLINEAGKDVGKWILPQHRRFILTYADYIPQETMFWRTELWQKTGGNVDESFRFAMDWELIRRFVLAEAKFELIPAFLGQFRMHDMQKTSASIETDGFKEMEIIRQLFRRDISDHPAVHNLYYRLQRAGLYAFLIKARLKELLWAAKLIKID
jgi:glycosyltransferase involved in cell wall biosynthesis